MAIRAPMMVEPEAATDVFAMYAGGTSQSYPQYLSGFPVDMALHRATTSTNSEIAARLTSKEVMHTNSSDGAGETSAAAFDYSNGWYTHGSPTAFTNYMSWMWKRAKSYFDVVAYSGNSTSGRTVSHSLGVTPEMMWVKRRNGAGEFKVYHAGVGPTKYMVLNSTDTQTTYQHLWNNTAPTSTVFTLGNDSGVNTNSNTYVAYLFATLDGISKVGSFVGNGTSQNIDCGFSSGARFVLLKNTSASHGWHLFDTTRGIVSGNDPYILLNTSAGQYTNLDMIDPHNSGFTVLDHGEINGNGNTIIFYAIA